MLAALLIMVLAATFALVIVAAVHGMQSVESSDASAWRAQSLERTSLARMSSLLRWRPLLSGSAEAGDDAAGQSWSAVWTPATSVAGDRWPRLRVDVSTVAGKARKQDVLTVLLRAESWASGVTCAGDLEVNAPLVVKGSGVYVAGCLRGRENVSFEEAPGVVPGLVAEGPADVVHGDVYPAAAVHGGAGIFAAGVEIHESTDDASYALDTDRHAGLTAPEDWLVGPSAEFLVAASAAAEPAGPALTDATLHLDQIDAATGAATITGRCILLPPLDEVVLDGSQHAAAGRLLIIVPGDAVVGAPGTTTVISGGLVVCGRLSVRGELFLDGSLHANSLVVDAPATVSVLPDWRDRPISGAAVMTIVEHGG